MPLPQPANRTAIHQRDIECRGFKRDDGLWDIEARMTDVKTYAVKNRDRGGEIAAGEAIHDMSIRLTLDNNLLIHDVAAVIDYAPFSLCPSITPAFEQLKGKSIGAGWTKLTKMLFSGTQGCTHLRELLGPLATTAFQTIYHASQREKGPDASKEKPVMLNSCHAFAETGDVVKDFWPDFYQPEKPS